ncbi:MAG TPA: universal stress protein [Chryseolinea sp.]|nr:universal stress protein [Chryseolinea sp.]
MKTILVPTNFSSYSSNALVTAASMTRAKGGRIVLMHNVETLLTNWSRLSEIERTNHPEIRNHADKAFREIHEMKSGALLSGLQVDPLITYGVTSDEIVAAAIKTKADLIVVGSGEREPTRDFIGSTLQKVVRQTPCPVLSIRKEISNEKWRKILVPVSLDFDIEGPFSEVAKISQEFGSVIQLLYVNTPQHFKNTATVKKQMNAFKEKFINLRIETAVYDHEEVEAGILEFAKSGTADCVAMITFEHQHAPSYQLSVTDHILHHATVPVLAIYEGAQILRRKTTAPV